MTIGNGGGGEEIPAIRRAAVEIFVILLGIAATALALGADQRWWDHHFLPEFDLPRPLFIFIQYCTRGVLAVFGAALVLVARPRLGRLAARLPPPKLGAALARVVVAILLALGSCEIILRVAFPHGIDRPSTNENLIYVVDQRLGWVFAPSRSVQVKIDGRAVDYTFDADSYRIRRPGETVDPNLPTILFTGESVMAGYGLGWDQSVPALVSSRLRIQSANLAVFGYSNDQAYLRLMDKLPKFSRPVAVISLFSTSLFDRNLSDDRPHFDPGLMWLSATHRWRLTALVRLLWPYRSDAAIERGVATTIAVLRSGVDLARSRGAQPLIVVPQFGLESPVERMLRQRILEVPKLPYVHVQLEPSWHLPGDLHPDARAAEAIATAVADRLQGLLTGDN